MIIVWLNFMSSSGYIINGLSFKSRYGFILNNYLEYHVNYNSYYYIQVRYLKKNNNNLVILKMRTIFPYIYIINLLHVCWTIFIMKKWTRKMCVVAKQQGIVNLLIIIKIIIVINMDGQIVYIILKIILKNIRFK